MNYFIDINGSNDLKAGSVYLLRETFKAGLLPQFTYHEDPSKNSIFIHTSFPRQLTKYPAIIVSVTSGTFDIQYLAQEYSKEEEIEGVKYNVFTGPIYLTLKIDIYARSEQDRTRLTDFIALAFRILFKEKLAERGFEYKDIKISGEGQEVTDTEIIFTNSVVIDVYTNYILKIQQEVYDIIQRIDISKIVNNENIELINLY